ncbi:glycosyltransferase [Candidatus Pelagibacter sp. Uisw_092]|uniref:glycosyltransferase n=1 Tax=Candidatus Pelagibacter sp. Uisw_092 TaxID=3230979 RepID=UPI0039E8C4CB
MKISILLPYKENFAKNYAGAVSLFVNDITKESNFKDTTYIFGNTSLKDKLSKNYININIKKNVFRSTSKQYVNSFLEYEKKINSDLIEVHNRPNYIRAIKKSFKNKIILYFHNDPLSMNGSKNIDERIFLLNNIDKIIFNSNWSKNRFFVNLPNKKLLSQKTSVCFQSASSTKINFKNKRKIISFVGKLNSAKGYDLFGDAIIKILNKHSDWEARVFGDEPREKLFFQHKNLKLFGFKNNDYILNTLKKVSISVVCSRWEEPFGRTSLEAASRGSAVIISNKGGLPETTPNAIILESLNSNTLFKAIDGLIRNKKNLINLQKANYQNFKYTHKFVSNIIDTIRKQLIPYILFNIKKNKPLKLLHITNFNDRFNGRLHYNTGRRLNNGFIRLGHNVLNISDRDVINKNKNISDFSGKKALQKTILDSYDNFKADALILGHADAITLETLDYIKSKNNNIKICQWFLDPLGKYGPDYIKNTKRIGDKQSLMDATFLTSDPSVLSKKIENSHFIPNPCDRSFEVLENYNNNCEYDVFFAMSHGVHRGSLKKGKFDDREIFINKLIKKNRDINFDIYGMNDVQPIWGDNFLNKISKSSMGLNLSRGRPIKYYSSDRIAQLIGNGLLTFVDSGTFFKDFLTKDQIVFYDDLNDLNYKLNKYKKDEKDRKRIAQNGKKIYLEKFNSTLVADFILSKTFDYKSKNNFIWDK